jgi:Insect cuticle protein
MPFYYDLAYSFFFVQSRNAYGVTTGSYQYIDANGLLQTVNYIADPVNGFRVAGTNLPTAPAVPAAAPLQAPVFDLPIPVAVEDTPEVAAAKAEFQAAFDAAAAAADAAPEEPAAEEAAAERRRRAAEEVAAAPVLAATPLLAAGLPYPYAAGVLAAAPADIVANIAHATPITAPALAYAGLPALAYAGAAPLAAAAPAREAVLTTVKLNPGHAIAYRVD